MTFKALSFFKKNNRKDIEIALYDSFGENNYFESVHSLVIEDNYKGIIVCSEDVFLKKNASFSGQLICTRCVIEGTFSGSLICTEYTEIGRNASLNAEILTGSIFIENKAAAIGEFRITKDIKTPESLNKLKNSHAESLRLEEAEEETKRIKKIILKQGLSTAGSRLSAEVIPAEAGIEPELKPSVGEITNPQPQLPVPKEEIISGSDSGWW